MKSLLKATAAVALSLTMIAGDVAFAAPRGGGGGGGGGGHAATGGGGGGGGGAMRGGGGGGAFRGGNIGGGPAVRSGGGGQRFSGPRMGNPGRSFNRVPGSGVHSGRGPRGDWVGKGHGGRGHHHRRGWGGFYGGPLYDYGWYDYNSGYGCGYYWSRWQRTGNPVWRARYYDCIG